LNVGKESGDFYEQIPTMYRELLYRLNDSIKDVVKTANAALLKISKCVSAEELVNHIEFCRNLVASIVSEARRRKGGVGDGEFLLPGFNMPKGKIRSPSRASLRYCNVMNFFIFPILYKVEGID